MSNEDDAQAANRLTRDWHKGQLTMEQLQTERLKLAVNRHEAPRRYTYRSLNTGYPYPSVPTAPYRGRWREGCRHRSLRGGLRLQERGQAVAG